MTPRVLCDRPFYAVGTSPENCHSLYSHTGVNTQWRLHTHTHTNPDPHLRHSNTFHLLTSDQDSLGLPPKKDPKIQYFFLPSALSSPPGPLPPPSTKDTNPRLGDAESPHPGPLQVRRHSLGPRAAPILPRWPLQCQLPTGLSLTDPRRCPRRRRQRQVWRQKA